MSQKHRIERLEDQCRAHEDKPPFVFTFMRPPKGLTPEQEEEWREERRRDCEARGVFFFTLNLGAAAVRVGDNE